MQCSYRPCVLLWLGTLLLVSLPPATADGLEWSGTTIIIVGGSAAGGVLLVIGGIVAYVLLHKQSSKVQAKQADDQYTSALEPGMDIELGGAKAVSPWVTPHNSPGESGQLLAQPWQPQQQQPLQPHEQQQQQQLQPWQQQQQQQQQQGTLVQPFDNAADHSQEDDGQYRSEEALAVEDFEAEEGNSHTERKKKKKKKKKDKDTEGGKKKKKKHSNAEDGEEAA